MYAIMEVGGKQYKVMKDDELLIDKLTSKAGEKVNFNTVTLYRSDNEVKVGAPYLKDVQVEGKVIEPVAKGDKITVFKYKSKVNYRVKTGHRQQYSKIKITGIVEGKGGSSSKSAAKETESTEK